MRKKDILGNEWLSKSFIFDSSMKKLDGEYEGYSAIQNFLPGSRELYVNDDGEKQCLSGEGYKWLTYLPMDKYWALIALYNPKGEMIRWYFDISKNNFLDENGIPCRDDIFLDLIILQDGRTITEDADELQEALNKGEISIDDYNHAYKVRDNLLNSKWSNIKFLASLSKTLLSDYF